MQGHALISFQEENRILIRLIVGGSASESQLHGSQHPSVEALAPESPTEGWVHRKSSGCDVRENTRHSPGSYDRQLHLYSMTMYTLHSWLRYAVFVLGLAAFAYALRGLITKQPYQKRMWDLASAFTFSLYVQIVLGFFLIFSTTHRFFDRSLGLHMVFSMVAVALAQMTYSTNRHRPREEREYGVHVWGVGLAMALVLAGILVIRDSIFG